MTPLGAELEVGQRRAQPRHGVMGLALDGADAASEGVGPVCCSVRSSK